MPQINVNIRMDKEVKEQAEILYNNLGFNLTTAFNVFVKQSLREQAIPFQPKMNIESNPTNQKETIKRLIKSLNNAEPLGDSKIDDILKQGISFKEIEGDI